MRDYRKDDSRLRASDGQKQAQARVRQHMSEIKRRQSPKYPYRYDDNQLPSNVMPNPDLEEANQLANQLVKKEEFRLK